MSRKNVTFSDKKINRSNLYRNKNLFNIDDTDINKLLASKRESHGRKV